MHDIRIIREFPDRFDTALSRRGLSALSGEILAIDEARRSKILAAETAQAEQNRASKEVGAAKPAATRPSSSGCAPSWPRRRPRWRG